MFTSIVRRRVPALITAGAAAAAVLALGAPAGANTGQQSGSDWVAVPHNLITGGHDFQTWFVPKSGQSHS